MHEHGIYIRGVPPDHVYEFWWCGEKVDVADFNERLINQTKSVLKDTHAFFDGFFLKEDINEGEKAVAKIDQIEDVLKLPLCPKCRSMIGGETT
jgi:hypothetical protein